MASEELNEKLYNKILSEFHYLESDLISKTPRGILDNAYRYVISQDVLAAVEELELSDEQAAALLSGDKNALAEIFSRWQKLETDHMQDIRNTISQAANTIIEHNKKYNLTEENKMATEKFDAGKTLFIDFSEKMVQGSVEVPKYDAPEQTVTRTYINMPSTSDYKGWQLVTGKPVLDRTVYDKTTGEKRIMEGWKTLPVSENAQYVLINTPKKEDGTYDYENQKKVTVTGAELKDIMDSWMNKGKEVVRETGKEAAAEEQKTDSGKEQTSAEHEEQEAENEK